MKKRIFALLMTCVLILGLGVPVSAETITHGTSDQWIQENMVRNNPPQDYSVNPSTQADAKEGLYSAYFPKDSLQEVHIEIGENNLNYLLQNAADEPYVMTTSVTIGDTTLGYCGLRTKGNYTLWHSYADNPGSDRFSFTINFGKYITKEAYGEKQNFYGLEKVSFNNFFFDKSMMKEYCALTVLQEMGLPTPEFALCKLYINGEYYGVYFMVEAMDDTVLERYYNADGKDISDYLVKPTGTNLDYRDLLEDDSPLWEYDEDTYADVENMLPTVMDWVKKLNHLSDGEDFDGNEIDVNSEQYLELLRSIMDLDEVVKYFAVHSWLVQTDDMFVNSQNYGLYISEAGVAALLPWDYDLSFGCYYPSTAETTANYPIDVMYQLDSRRYDEEAETSASIYKRYPLFDVIYQNETLMAQYHEYMAQCSQIAALGGTVASTGKSYDPGFIHSRIETLEEALIDAATEELADNCYYMNNIRQPSDVKEALPNLSRIIAMRSVGVWAQVKGLETTVSGSGCDLSTLGNAMNGEASNSGTLTTVDAATGIFATAEYNGSRRAFSPSLNVTVLTENDSEYQQIASSLSLGRGDTLLVWEGSVNVQAASDYTLTVPLAQEYLKDENEYSFYSCSAGELTALEMTREDNLFTGTASRLDCIAVVIHSPVDYTLYYIAAGAAAVLLIGIAALVIVKRKKKTAQ